MGDPEAFFLADGDRFVPTELTRGPWSRGHQHGGPPSALMGRVIERAAPGFMLTRFTVDFLRPVPIEPLTVRTAMLREGRKVQRVIATLHAGDQIVAHAVALLVRTAEVGLPARVGPPALPPPDRSAPFQFPFFTDPVGYHTAVEGRIARGVFWTGEVAAWIRMRFPLLPAEPPSPLERVLVAADSGSGVSAALDPKRYSFVNSDLTVYLHRPLEGEWVGLDAVTTPEPSGIGLARTALHDGRGVIGAAFQGLVVEERR